MSLQPVNSPSAFCGDPARGGHSLTKLARVAAACYEAEKVLAAGGSPAEEAAVVLFDSPQVRRIIDLGLEEDLGRGDVTTLATVPAGALGRARILTRQHCVVAGLPLLAKVFDRIGAGVVLEPGFTEGDEAETGATIVHLSGPLQVILAGERLALNFMQRMCAVADLTRRYVEAVKGTRARIADTRKTAPGQRILDKYAVRVGGGINHRHGLDGGILIKENHIAAAGSIAQAVAAARKLAPFCWRIHVEVRDLRETDEALAAGAEGLLFDNMTVDTLRAAVARAAGRAITEASGGIDLARVRAVADCGVDVISVGALTHSAGIADLSLLVERDDAWKPAAAG